MNTSQIYFANLPFQTKSLMYLIAMLDHMRMSMTKALGRKPDF